MTNWNPGAWQEYLLDPAQRSAARGGHAPVQGAADAPSGTLDE